MQPVQLPGPLSASVSGASARTPAEIPSRRPLPPTSPAVPVPSVGSPSSPQPADLSRLLLSRKLTVSFGCGPVTLPCTLTLPAGSLGSPLPAPPTAVPQLLRCTRLEITASPQGPVFPQGRETEQRLAMIR